MRSVGAKGAGRPGAEARGAEPFVVAGILSSFGLFGAAFGIWQALVADVREALGLSPGALGFAISAGLVASLPAMVVAGRAADRFGRAPVVAIAGTLVGLAFMGLSAASSYWALVGTLLLFFAATGAYDVGINAAAMGFEQRTGRKILSVAHAAFSGGAALAALAVGVLLYRGLSFHPLFIGGALFLWAVLVPAVHGVGRSGGGAGVDGAQGTQEADGVNGRLPLRPAVLLVAAVALLANLAQGGMENWSAVYLRLALDLSALLGASAVAVFHSAMLVGRLGAAGAIRRFGRPATLRTAGFLAAAGMAFALSVETPALVLAGILAVGLSLAAVAPIAFSLAGDAAGEKMGQASSVVTTVSYGGLLLGPALIGGLAEVVGLRGALVAVVVASLLVAVLGFFVRNEHRSSDDSPAEEKANGASRRRPE